MTVANNMASHHRIQVANLIHRMTNVLEVRVAGKVGRFVIACSSADSKRHAVKYNFTYLRLLDPIKETYH